jgi:hypothetical protein
MLDDVRSIQRKYRGWNKLIGDTTTRIVAHYLRKHLSRRIRLVKAGYVEGCKNEFDLLLVGRNTKPMGLTNVYRKTDVRAIIEVKTSGSRDKLYKFSSKQATFRQIGEFLGKPVLYLSLLHTPKYAEEVVRILGKDAFILQIRRKMNERDWRRFLRRIGSMR